jgi:hypothetical protein
MVVWWYDCGVGREYPCATTLLVEIPKIPRFEETKKPCGFEWISAHSKKPRVVKDISDSTALLAVQGPLSADHIFFSKLS